MPLTKVLQKMLVNHKFNALHVFKLQNLVINKFLFSNNTFEINEVLIIVAFGYFY